MFASQMSDYCKYISYAYQCFDERECCIRLLTKKGCCIRYVNLLISFVLSKYLLGISDQ